MEAYEQIYGVMRAEGVNVAGSVNWAADIKKVCEPTPDDFMADKRDMACKTAKSMEKIEAMPLKAMEIFTQISMTGRFQEYIKDFSAENQEAPLV